MKDLEEVFFFSEMFLQATEMETVKFANSLDPNEVAHDEPPHLDLHCLPANSF